MIFIELNNVRKYKKRQALLKPLSITLTNQAIWYIKGPNGSGKSTLLKCLMHLIKNKGVITTNVSTIAYGPEKNFLPDYVSVERFLMTLSRYYQIKNDDIVIEYLKNWGLYESRHKSINHLSKGNRQKVLLIQALMQDADAYFFDEPLSGLDDKSSLLFIKDIMKKFEQAKLVVIATHYIEKYPKINQRVIVFENHDYVS